MTSKIHWKIHLSGFLDRVDSKDCDAISGHDAIAEEPVEEELHVTRHLAMGHRVGSLLQFQDLEVVALDLVRHDEERIQRAFGTSGLL